MILSNKPAVLLAPMCEGLFLDPFSLFNDGGCPVEVGIGRRYVLAAFVISLVICNVRRTIRSCLGFADGRAHRTHGSSCGLRYAASSSVI